MFIYNEIKENKVAKIEINEGNIKSDVLNYRNVKKTEIKKVSKKSWDGGQRNRKKQMVKNWEMRQKKVNILTNVIKIYNLSLIFMKK